MKYTIIQDTREKKGWEFSMAEECEGVVSKGLSEGDYTTQELYDLEFELGKKILRIERKASSGELANNLGQGKDRFFREMGRLKDCLHKYLILEFSMETLLAFPYGSGIPSIRWYKQGKNGKRVRRIKMSGPYMLSLLEDIERIYKVKIIYAGDASSAQEEAIRIIQEVHSEYKDKIQS